MYVQEIIETRVLDRVYKIEQCKEGALTEWRVQIVADPGSYRASAQHHTIITEVALTHREKAVEVFNAIVTTALDSVATPFESGVTA